MAKDLTSRARTNRKDAEIERLRRAMNENAENGLAAAGEAVELRHALQDIAAQPATTLEALGLQARVRKHLAEITGKYRQERERLHERRQVQS